MAKNAAKKRRRGTAKVTQKSNKSRFRKPQFRSEVVKKYWDNGLAADVNMAKLGLRSNANTGVRALAQAAVATAPGGQLAKESGVARLFDVPNSNDLRVVDRNPGRRPLSPEDQQYALALMERFGLDYEAMSMDMKINYNQLTLGQVRRMCKTLLSLEKEHRVVTIPKRILQEASSASGTNAGAMEVDVQPEIPSEKGASSAVQEVASENSKLKRKKRKNGGGKAKGQK